MSLPRAQMQLRPGRPDELDLASAIDDDAGMQFEELGIDLAIAKDHPFVLAERQDWARAAAADRLWFALATSGQAVGLVVCDFVDGEPYLEQLSVRRLHMRQGVGALMLAHAIRWAQPGPLWLTTYAHVPWNRPYYERAGFVVVDEAQWGAGMREIVASQRSVLPAPAQRVVMRRPAGPP